MSLILQYNLQDLRRLPENYQLVLYIENTNSTGDYLDTGFAPNNNTKIEIDFQMTSYSDGFVCGGRDSFGSNMFAIHPSYSQFGSTTGLNYGFGNDLKRHHVTLSLSGVYIDSATAKLTYSTLTFLSPVNLVLFNCRLSAGIYNGGGTVRIFSFKMWDGDTLIRDMIPCTDSGLLYMYDIVNQKEYPLNSGTYIYSSEVYNLPYEYLQVEYLESTGILYINTGSAISSGVGFKCKWSNVFNSSGSIVLGSSENKGYGLGNTSGNNPNIAGGGRISNTYILMWINGANYSSSLKAANAKGIYIDDIDCTTSGSLVAYMDENNGNNYIEKSLSVSTFASLNMYLFRDSSGSYPFYSVKRIYDVQFYTSTATTKHLIPCYRRADMVPGMYDIVGRLFYINSGSGVFSVGPVVEASYRLLELNQAGFNQFAKDLNTWSFSTATSGGTKLQRQSSLYFNKIAGPWSVSFDIVGTADCTVTTDICDCNGSASGTKTIAVTTTKQRCFVSATAGNYYYGSYNGFWDFQLPLTSSVITITVSNIMFTHSSITSPEKYIPKYTYGIHNNTGGYCIKSKYDDDYLIEDDGSVWVHVFHHNNPNAPNLFSSSDNFMDVYKDSNRWSLMELLNQVDKWEFLIKLKTTSSGTELKFRFIQCINPLNNGSAMEISYNKSTGYSTSSYKAIRYYNSSAYLCCASSCWWGAFGTWANWSNNSIPGWNGLTITTGYSDLYLRIDNIKKLATKFDGSSSFVALYQTPLYSLFNTNTYTISFWFYLTSVPTDTRCMFSCRGDNGTDHLIFIGFSSGNLTSSHYSDDHSVSVAILKYRWNMLTLTSNNKSCNMYLNGASILTYTSGALALSSSSVLGIGADVDRSNYFFNGMIKDLRIYDTALSAFEVKQIYNN